MMEPEIGKSALIVIDMQNDFVHPEGSFGVRARQPHSPIDFPFLTGTIPQVKRLADAFRMAGRPAVFIAHVLKSDYSDAQFPYWRLGIPQGSNHTFIAEGTGGAQIVDDLKTTDDCRCDARPCHHGSK